MNFEIGKALDIALNKVQTWLEATASMLPNLAVAIIVLVFFFFLARLFRNVSFKLLNRLSAQNAINSLLSTMIYIIVLGIGLVVALNVLQLERTVTSLLAGAGILGLALGFAFQDIAANFMSGILIVIRRPIVIGDIIKTQDFMGIVEDINLRATILRTFQGIHVIIPNKDIFQNTLMNYTKTNDIRIDLEVGISYGDDLEKVKQLVTDTINTLPYLLPNKPVNFFYQEFGDSSINFITTFWVEYTEHSNYMRARSEAIIAIKKAFDSHDITIPFPIRTLDFGIKGGEKISEMPLNIKKD